MNRFRIAITALMTMSMMAAIPALAGEHESAPCAVHPPMPPMMCFAAVEDAPPAPDAPERPMKNRRHVEQFRMLKLLELLELGEDQEVDFLIAFKADRARRGEIHEARETLVTELADGLREGTIQDDRIFQLANEMEQLKAAYGEAAQQFLYVSRKILTPAQFGRLVVFQERFEFELLDKIRSFRDRRGGQAGQRGQGPRTPRSPGQID